MHAAGLTRAVGGGAVLGGVVDELELGQLDGLHHERRVLLGVPLEYQVIRRVGHCTYLTSILNIKYRALLLDKYLLRNRKWNVASSSLANITGGSGNSGRALRHCQRKLPVNVQRLSPLCPFKLHFTTPVKPEMVHQHLHCPELLTSA